MKNVQIPYDLFVALVEYHLGYDDEYEDETVSYTHLMGFTALAIAERVGHESIDITYRYAHLFPTRQVEMADKLDSLKTEKGA